jgi:amylosucrase
MDWEAATRRRAPGSVEQRVFDGLCALAAARAATPHLHAAVPVEVLDLDPPELLAVVRRHPLGPLLCAYNLSDRPAFLPGGAAAELGLGETVDRIGGGRVDAAAGVALAPYGAVWLAAPDDD